MVRLLRIGAAVMALGFPAVALCQDVEERRSRTAIMLHRGAADLAVENTLSAIEAAILAGGDGVEIDLRADRGGKVVLMHDPWVDRVLDCVGPVSDWHIAELRLYPFRKPLVLTRTDERVPTLRQALELIKKHNALIHLDIKVPGHDAEIRQLLEKHGLRGNVVTVNPFNHEAVIADSRVQLLPSQGAVIHGKNDYDAESFQPLLTRPSKGTLLVDDPRCAAALLGRESKPFELSDLPHPMIPVGFVDPRAEAALQVLINRERVEKAVEQETADPPFQAEDRWWVVGRLAAGGWDAPSSIRDELGEALEADSDDLDAIEAAGELALRRATPLLIERLQQIPAAAEFVPPRDQKIRLRAALAKALGKIGDPLSIAPLRKAARTESLSLNGAWQGLDGAEAVKALARIDAAGNVDIFREIIWDDDPRLEAMVENEEQPWYLREQRNWWNFRIKGEAFIALGQAG
ncbi:MAG: glycerophosphodiester phosphodiesterase family protein, partial [Verrucomicrobiota bacterium]